MSSNIQLSACIIARDEEDVLAFCLASIQSIAKEIIVVDTGSTDRTKEIAQQYRAKVFDYSWNANFADARNYALEQATGEWILYIDADERLDPDGLIFIQEAMKNEQLLLLGLKVVNYFGSSPVQYERSYLLAQYRIFRRNCAKFAGVIHEQLEFNVTLEPTQYQMLPAQLFHYGYITERIHAKNKSNRNVELLLKEKINHSDNPWIDYFIANELNELGEQVKAYEFVNFAITSFIAKKQIPPSLVYRLKYSIIIDMEQYEDSDKSIDLAIKIYPDYVYLHYYKGIILKGQGRYAEAIEEFNEAIRIGENNIQHLTLTGTGSFLASFQKALCLEKQGLQSSALQLIERVLLQYKEYAPAQEARSRIRSIYQ